MPFARETLANYLTETIRDVVREEVLDPTRSGGKLYREPRIFDDLLSSQPLCFNVFAHLRRDIALASKVFEDVLDEAGAPRPPHRDRAHSRSRGVKRSHTDIHLP